MLASLFLASFLDYRASRCLLLLFININLERARWASAVCICTSIKIMLHSNWLPAMLRLRPAQTAAAIHSASACLRSKSSSKKPFAPAAMPLNMHLEGMPITNPADDEADKPSAFDLKVAAAKETLKWRRPYSEVEGVWSSKFKVFSKDRNDMDTGMIAFIQQPFDFSLKARREKRERKRVADERFMQQFVPERHQMLGNDLAAAHFLVHRGGAVKYALRENGGAEEGESIHR